MMKHFIVWMDPNNNKGRQMAEKINGLTLNSHPDGVSGALREYLKIASFSDVDDKFTIEPATLFTASMNMNGNDALAFLIYSDEPESSITGASLEDDLKLILKKSGTKKVSDDVLYKALDGNAVNWFYSRHRQEIQNWLIENMKLMDDFNHTLCDVLDGKWQSLLWEVVYQFLYKEVLPHLDAQGGIE